jgi:Uma2 family endonuclease
MVTVVAVAGEQRVLLDEVNWEAYEALLKSGGGRKGRMTYDRGRLEIMSPLRRHELFGALIRQMIELYTLERDIPRSSGGTTTFRAEARQRGLEPDASYWIQHEEQMRGPRDFDPETDPPPDLAIEVDITSSSLDRMSIYASLGVPEIWRFDGDKLTIHLLQAGETYAPSSRSLALPELLPDDLMRFLRLSNEQDEVSLLRGFLQWVREGQKLKGKPAKKPRPHKG